MSQKCTLPWMCIGDFNEILRRFRDAVDICGLSDIGLDWTWQKKVPGNTNVRVRLDRALADAAWCSDFPCATLDDLTATKSDHCPILLQTGREEIRGAGRSGGKLYRYELVWEKDVNFQYVVEHA